MKIVNKEFHDYYDSCMGYGIDLTIVYDRMRALLDLNSKTFKESEKLLYQIPQGFYYESAYLNKEFVSKKSNYLFESGIIGFCGIFYPFIKVTTVTKGKYLAYSAEYINYFYSTESVMDFLFKIKYNFNSSSFRKSRFSKNILDNIFATIDYSETFFEIKNPIWVNAPVPNSSGYISGFEYSNQNRREFTINPKLADFQFYKLFDAFSTFQRISNFISGVLGDVHPPLIEVSDEVKKHKAGFDDWSFKNKVHKRKYLKRNKG